MSSYKEIVGQKITKVSSDPSNVETGQMWYNSTSGQLKGHVKVLSGSWASGGTLNTSPGRFQLGGAGTQTAALAFGGGTQWP